MASKGSLKLESSALLEVYNAIKGYETTVQEALYEQYKSAYKISVTNYMREMQRMPLNHIFRRERSI